MNTPINPNLMFTSFVVKQLTEKLSSLRRQPARLALMSAVAIAGLASALPASAVTVAQLAGDWQAAISLNGGCGLGTKLVTFTLNSEGVATNAVGEYHTQECGDATETGTFKITYLSPQGHGDATMDFSGTVFNFHIQVAPNGQIFNLVEIADPGNYQSGTAVIQ